MTIASSSLKNDISQNSFFISKSNINNQLRALKIIRSHFRSIKNIAIHLESDSIKKKLNSINTEDVQTITKIDDYKSYTSKYNYHVFSDKVGVGQSTKVLESFFNDHIVIATKKSLRNLDLPEIFHQNNNLDRLPENLEDINKSSLLASSVIKNNHSYMKFQDAIYKFLYHTSS